MLAYAFKGAITTLAGAAATLVVNNIAQSFHRVRLQQEADRSSLWTCDAMHMATTGKSAFCEELEVRARRPFALQLLIQNLNDLPWCGPFDCSSGASMTFAHVALVGVVLAFLFALIRLWTIAAMRRKNPFYARSGSVPVIKS